MTATAVQPSTSVELVTRPVTADFVNRSLEMQLMQEDLARAHLNARLEQAQRERVLRALRAQRAARRAEEAAQRARRLLALAVLR
jgi:hypothetical protein